MKLCVRKAILCTIKHPYERKLRVFENMVLTRIVGPRRDEVTGGMEETA